MTHSILKSTVMKDCVTDNNFFRIIVDADSSSVVSRVALRNDDIPIGEQTVAQVTNAIHNLFW